MVEGARIETSELLALTVPARAGWSGFPDFRYERFISCDLGYEAAEPPDAGYKDVPSLDEGEDGVYLPPRSTDKSPR